MSIAPGRDPARPRPIEERLRTAGLPPLDRAAWLEVDTHALRRNLAVIRERVAAGTQVWPVVKDDAYGHGIEVASRAFAAGGADGLCVATLGEAMAVRSAGVALPVLLLYPIPDEALQDAARAGFEVTISTSHGAASAARAWAAGPVDGTLVAHVEVDTGFTRMGIHPERLAEALEAIRRPGIRVAALWSHLATPEDATTAGAQEARLDAAATLARGWGIEGTHLAASGGILTGRGIARALVRPGLIAYGVLPDGPLGEAADDPMRQALVPALRLVARPMRIQEVAAGTRVGYGGAWVAPRPSRIATLPVGYGDGYARASTGADVLVQGRHAPVVGVISMDACTVDVTDVPGASLEDEHVLLGAQGSGSVSAGTLAQRRTTIPWEVLAGMARRLTRVYDAAVGPSGVRTPAGETLVR